MFRNFVPGKGFSLLNRTHLAPPFPVFLKNFKRESMKHRSILLTILAALFLQPLYAQQQQHYTQFMYNKLLINPGYAGMREVPSLTAIYRNQWAGFEGAPQSALLSFNSPFFTPRVGIGGTVSHVTIGLQRDLNIQLAYSYAIVADKDFTLRLGLLGSLRSLGLNFQEASPYQDIDPSIDNRRINDLYTNAGIGLYGVWRQQVFAGFSVPRLIENSIGLNLDQGVTTARERRHYYANVGGIIPLRKEVRLLTSVLFKYVDNAPLNADINMNLEYKKFTGGLSYRTGGDGPGESVDLLAFYQFHPQVGVGAAYDFTLSDLRDYSAGSFELLLMADLKKIKKRRMSNPRFFM